jgi:PqqD family protein of HPr-rel-A system
VKQVAVQQWQAAAPLIWICYDDSDDWVVYNPLSADVHLLTASAYRLWKLASDGQPHSVEELASALAVEMGWRPDDELTKIARDTLTFLDHAGLVRSVSS